MKKKVMKKKVMKKNNPNTVRTCVLCGAPLGQFEWNNPWPLAADGECCDVCNIRVIRARIRGEKAK